MQQNPKNVLPRKDSTSRTSSSSRPAPSSTGSASSAASNVSIPAITPSSGLGDPLGGKFASINLTPIPLSRKPTKTQAERNSGLDPVPKVYVQQPSSESLVPNSPLTYHHMDITSTFPMTFAATQGVFTLVSLSKTSYRDKIRCQFKYESNVPLHYLAIRLICQIDKSAFQDPIDLIAIKNDEVKDDLNLSASQNAGQRTLVITSQNNKLATGECGFTVETDFIPCLYHALHALGSELSDDDFQIDGTMVLAFNVYHLKQQTADPQIPSIGRKTSISNHHTNSAINDAKNAPVSRKASISNHHQNSATQTTTHSTPSAPHSKTPTIVLPGADSHLDLSKHTLLFSATFNVDFSVLKTSRPDREFLQPNLSKRKKQQQSQQQQDLPLGSDIESGNPYNTQTDMNSEEFSSMF